MTWMKRIFPPPYTTLDKGHGRIEKRTIQTSTVQNDYLEFPYIAQVIRVNRVFTKFAKIKKDLLLQIAL